MTDEEIRIAAEAAVNTRSAYVCLPATAVLNLLDRACLPAEITALRETVQGVRAEVDKAILLFHEEFEK